MSFVTALLSLMLSFAHIGPASASHARMVQPPAASGGTCTSTHCNHNGGGIQGGLIL